jgi:hypothetical protein
VRFSRRSRHAAALAQVLLALAACSTQTSEPPREPFGPGVMVRIASQGEALPASFEGVVIDIGPGVKYEAVLSSVNGESQTRATINGHPFKVEGPWISIGPQRFGPVASGDKVTLDEAGVHLNGQLAGQIPPRKAEEPK